MLLSSTLSILMFCTLCLFSAGLGLGLNPNNFDSEVQGDDRVWVIEFFSKMCGSCQEFAPTWSKLKKKLPSFRVAEVDIDQKAGMQLAEKLGVLEEGIPCLRLFHSKSQPNGISVLNSESSQELSDVVAAVKKAIKGLPKNDEGFYLKRD